MRKGLPEEWFLENSLGCTSKKTCSFHFLFTPHPMNLPDNFEPFEISLEEAKQYLPSFLTVTPEMLACQSFGKSIQQHPYFDAAPPPTLTREETDHIREECGSFLPKTAQQLEQMKQCIATESTVVAKKAAYR